MKLSLQNLVTKTDPSARSPLDMPPVSPVAPTHLPSLLDTEPECPVG